MAICIARCRCADGNAGAILVARAPGTFPVVLRPKTHNSGKGNTRAGQRAAGSGQWAVATTLSSCASEAGDSAASRLPLSTGHRWLPRGPRHAWWQVRQRWRASHQFRACARLCRRAAGGADLAPMPIRSRQVLDENPEFQYWLEDYPEGLPSIILRVVAPVPRDVHRGAQAHVGAHITRLDEPDHALRPGMGRWRARGYQHSDDPASPTPCGADSVAGAGHGSDA